MKKQVIVLSVVVMLMSVLSMSVTAKQVTLKFMGWEASPLETQSVKEGLVTFMKQNPGIKVEYTPVPQSDYTSKLFTMMVGHTAPDVFFINSADYRAFQKKSVLLNLTKYFNRELNMDEFIPMVREKMLIGKEIYGVSSCNVSPVLFYNKDLFDEAGLPYPPSDPEKAWTWEEFIEVSKKLTITKGKKTIQYGGYGFESTWGWVFPAMIYSNGGRVFNDDYSKLLLDSPEAKEVFRSIRDLNEKYGVTPEGVFLEQSGMSPTQMLQTGRVAMLVEGSWALQELAQMDFSVGIGVLPKFKKPATVGQAHLHAAWAKTQYPEEAWKLIKFLSSGDYQLSNVRAGLWLPNRKELYKKENLNKWMNPNVYPEGFENMATYFTQYGELWPGVKAPQEAWDIIMEELEKFRMGGQSLDKVIAGMSKRVKPILKSTK